MSDLISRQGLIELVNNYCKLCIYTAKERKSVCKACNVNDIKLMICDFPSAEKTGHWVHGERLPSARTYCKCSNCFTEIESDMFAFDFDMNFCPNCGAKMSESEVNK